MPENKYEAANREHWNEVTSVHLEAEEFYGLQAFKAGESTLCKEEMADVGPVEGKSLLHLQCHFGMDTLSWARLGAKVTGMDISDASIDEATKLANEIGADARFIRCNLYDLPDHLDEQFDIVYTGRGAILWLKDLEEWARIVSRYLKPGGILYLMDTHPTLDLFWEMEEGKLEADGSYFHRAEPDEFPAGDSDYADASYKDKTTDYGWRWPIQDILNALIKAGLRLELFREYDRCYFQVYPEMVRQEAIWWTLPAYEGRIPMTFSLVARKETR
ncbi:class I SAM-dependent methyltransferase [bacterium]|nr:class I SAM-dependent methyltransferase [bacterium]